jgi:hypothetical protein
MTINEPGGAMKSRLAAALLAAVTAVAITAVAVPAAAATSGSETVSGRLVTSGVSGTRTTIATVAVARGVFNGVGRIVEIPPQPGDPANVSRDDLVYPVGTMHLVNTTVGVVSPSLNPHNCLFRVTLEEDSQIIGGTGLFAHASGTFTGTISPQGLLPHNPDNSCAAIGTPSLHEVDMVAFSGTLSF